MFQLHPLSKTIRDEYTDKLLDGLIKRLTNGRVYNGAKYRLGSAALDVLMPKLRNGTRDKSVLSHLLMDEPKELVALNDKITNSFKRLKKCAPSKKTLEVLFNYDGVFNNDKDTSYWLAKLIQRNTCTYCNRQYIFTIERPVITSVKDYITRPVFDHWFAKADYPLLSLSLHNLIPSCTTCNSAVKGRTPMSLSTHIHPYVIEPKEAKFTFRATKTISTQPDWELRIDRPKGSRIDKTIQDFALDEIYSVHAQLEVKDIMDFNDAYPAEYLKSLFSDMQKKNKWRLSREEVYRILFGTELCSEKFLDRPFSKLKHDLLKQIGVIK